MFSEEHNTLTHTERKLAMLDLIKILVDLPTQYDLTEEQYREVTKMLNIARKLRRDLIDTKC
jgi:hypothetical protein